MNRFPDKCIGEFHPNGRLFKFYANFRYYTSIDPDKFGYSNPLPPLVGGGWVITIPKDFITDFASSPRLIWSIVPPIGLISFGAAVHDFIYTTDLIGRSWGDDVLLEAAKTMGMNWLERDLYYYGVRVGGRMSYDERCSFDWPAIQ